MSFRRSDSLAIPVSSLLTVTAQLIACRTRDIRTNRFSVSLSGNKCPVRKRGPSLVEADYLPRLRNRLSLQQHELSSPVAEGICLKLM